MPYYPTEFPHKAWITLLRDVPPNEVSIDRPSSALSKGVCFFTNEDTSLIVLEEIPVHAFLVDYVDPEKVLPPEQDQSPPPDPDNLVA